MMGQKILRLKLTLENLKIGKLSGTLATSNFQELFVNKFDLNSNRLKKKTFSGSIRTKKSKGKECPRAKYG